jgi:catechol 2,3-dioxygenase-like lactoylglutathione lyase family enzyme
MGLGGVSHIAIGVRDMDRSLAFYRDLLGMRVTRDQQERTGRSAMYAREDKSGRRAVHLRWEDDPEAPFLVLSEFPATSGEAIRLDQVGIHHVALWVSDLEQRADKLRAAGVPFVLDPIEVDAAGYDGAQGERVMTCLFQDPDGIILQLDQRV